MERQNEQIAELTELGTATEVTQGATFGVIEKDGLRPTGAISPE